jgi:hypothetical protein
MSNERVGIDEFIERQRGRGRRAVIAEIPADETHVKVTPYAAGADCLCEAALRLPKAAIAAVTITDETHVCCGQATPVVEIEFHDGLVADIFSQVAESATRRPRSASEFDIDWQCASRCSEELVECMQWARGEWDRCWCRNMFFACHGSCGGRRPPFEWCMPDPY